MAFGDILNWVPFSKMKAEDAKEILKDKGYPFANLWNEIRPLQKPQIDLSLIIPVYNNEKYIDIDVKDAESDQWNESQEEIEFNEIS